ncbi:NAD(P)-dependent oxidoreductase [Levilactobacillus enshiensis]|uniref:NAD(P)-dependent oxidoreductase n=1 Tax=Levilactobacillus enshiensis TaxID=2590213 RepID=UPI00117A5F32|nr:NAD(P)-dependent oxidoreductase [Levilactobacillus enshiensis]
MTERILTFQALNPDQTKQIEALGAEVVPFEKLAEASGITAIFGWSRKHGLNVLQDPHNDVKWIQTVSAGVDYLPLDYIKNHHIMLSNAVGVYSPAIAESTIGYLLYFLRGFNEAVKNQAGHFWQPPERNDLVLLASQKVVIYGTGSIGQSIAELLNGFGNYPYGVNRSGRSVAGFAGTVAQKDDAALIKDTDVIINAMPSTPETDHYFNEAYFSQLNGVRVFVNVGRGTSVDEQALIDGLLHQNVLNAALDVFNTEPLPKDSKLWDLPNVLVTPHQTGFAMENTAPIFGFLADNLKSLQETGELKVNVVDPGRGY